MSKGERARFWGLVAVICIGAAVIIGHTDVQHDTSGLSQIRWLIAAIFWCIGVPAAAYCICIPFEKK